MFTPMEAAATASGEPPYTHTLLDNSLALNAIPTENCLLSDDQRGISRPQSKSCDIGAFERETQALYFPIILKN
ncbi:MAG: choice-of-anchor Q domain-containing protein [Chloroflexota bacterium]